MCTPTKQIMFRTTKSNNSTSKQEPELLITYLKKLKKYSFSIQIQVLEH